MGRIFEKRKYKMFARFARMSKAFNKMGREIAVAVKAGGGDPAYNTRLRMAIQTARSLNMPKDRIDAAIKRALSKDTENYQEVVYEAYGPHGVAVMIECATDNPTRTVANIRAILVRNGATLGASGSVSFLFERKGVFRIAAGTSDMDELELELIDYGADEIERGDGELIVYTTFENFAGMQKALEDKSINILSAELQRIPTSINELDDAAADEVGQLVEKLDEDDDVQAVFHNMR
ncbi:MAG: YebC/PmpR family DNA-binding transcriptional regulator [Acidobacteria bacterium]|nr:MAG: YebC/PmpR family DNA-binding transcriptional regulator [Acidobacteriota bacterium]